jgi:hypothetical protein
MTIQAIDLSKDPVFDMLRNTQKLHAKLFELTAFNFTRFLKYAEQLSRVRSAQEFAEVAADQMREHFEAIEEQFEELSSTIREASSNDDAAAESGLGD